MEFVYDLKLPNEFQPCVSDGEVEEFYCWPIEKVMKWGKILGYSSPVYRLSLEYTKIINSLSIYVYNNNNNNNNNI